MSEILVLGGTGKTGRRLVDALAEEGHRPRAASRHPGVDGMRFDWDDEETWGDALAGAEAVYIVPPALRLDYAPAVGRLIGRARAARVERAVLLSARGAETGDGTPIGEAEALAVGAGLEWVVLRPTWFMQNFSEGVFAEGIASRGEIVAPTGDGATPFVDASDIAAAAAAALTGRARAGRVYELTGPRALTFTDAATAIGAAGGNAVRHVDLPAQAWETGAREMGLPADYAALLAHLFTVVREGHDAHVANGVEEATGRAPRPFEAFADDAARRRAAA